MVVDSTAAEADESHTDGIPDPPVSEHPASETSAVGIESAPNDNVIDSGLAADFTDDDVDAEVRSSQLCGLLVLIVS